MIARYLKRGHFQIEIDPDWGIPEDEYVKVASDLADETAQLIGALT